MPEHIRLEDLDKILGQDELATIEVEIMRMLQAETTKDCGTGTCS